MCSIHPYLHLFGLLQYDSSFWFPPLAQSFTSLRVFQRWWEFSGGQFPIPMGVEIPLFQCWRWDLRIIVSGTRTERFLTFDALWGAVYASAEPFKILGGEATLDMRLQELIFGWLCFAEKNIKILLSGMGSSYNFSYSCISSRRGAPDVLRIAVQP